MPTVDLSHVTVDTVSVSEAVAELESRLPADGPGHLPRASPATCTTRIEIIVRFLALLELCKLGRVTLGQGHTFGDLEVAWVADAPVPGAGRGRPTYDEYEG